MTVTKFPQGRVLTALNAEVTTATISITAMTIDRRQVTLSVFRQLVEEPIFDPQTMKLNGVGWGWVKYLIDEGPDVAINLVWQRGDVLRRCKVYREVKPYQLEMEEFGYRTSATRDKFLKEGFTVEGNDGEERVLSITKTIRSDWNLPSVHLSKTKRFPNFARQKFPEPAPQYQYVGNLLEALRHEPNADLPEALRLSLAENHDLVEKARSIKDPIGYLGLKCNPEWLTKAGKSTGPVQQRMLLLKVRWKRRITRHAMPLWRLTAPSSCCL